MGIKAKTLRYRSKRDGEIIVGSEIRAALDELENENSELRAQLASTRNAVQECFRGMSNIACDGKLLLSAGRYNDFVEKFNAMSDQAKADAEVLRCAEEEFAEHNFDEQDFCVCRLCCAVRAAKEARDEKRSIGSVG